MASQFVIIKVKNSFKMFKMRSRTSLIRSKIVQLVLTILKRVESKFKSPKGIVLDMFFALAVLPCSLLAMLKESSLTNSDLFEQTFNQGSFWCAGVLGLFTILLYVINICVSIVSMIIELRILKDKTYEHRCRSCGSYYELISKSIASYPYYVLMFNGELKY
jgi:hypothetical protein